MGTSCRLCGQVVAHSDIALVRITYEARFKNLLDKRVLNNPQNLKRYPAILGWTNRPSDVAPLKPRQYEKSDEDQYANH